MPPRRGPSRPDETNTGDSANPATTNGPNLQFISSEIARVPKLAISNCTPDGFQILKQPRHSLSRETHKALFTNALNDVTVKQMNILGLQDVNAIIEAFQIQVCGSSSVFVHEYELHNRSEGTNDSFEMFYTEIANPVE